MEYTDIENLCHALGLRLSINLKYIMFPYCNSKTTELEVDDILGIQNLYNVSFYNKPKTSMNIA